MVTGKVLVTGANGFVGRAVLEKLSKLPGPCAVGLSRQPQAGCGLMHSPELSEHADWRKLLTGVQAVVHCAARAHVEDNTTASREVFQRINTLGTLSLARQAAEAGVARFVFISTVKVHGEQSPEGAALTAESPANPSDPYAQSKWDAEIGLREIAQQTGMEVVILRPVLVYGPRVQANFLSMMRWLRRGVPLPLGALHNKRSMIALDNLSDLVMRSITHPAAANRSFLASDGEDLTVTSLLQRLGRAMGKPTHLYAVPVQLLQAVAALAGIQGSVQRMCTPLQVDITATRTALDWTPPVSVDDALGETAKWYLETPSQ